jgi:hypothetical protein
VVFLEGHSRAQGVDAETAQLPLTFVFMQWCASEAASCPQNQTLNDDKTLFLLITTPLQKHFVGGCVAFSSLHS